MGLEDKPNQSLHKKDVGKLIEGKIKPRYTVSYSSNDFGKFNDLLLKLNSHI